MELENIFNKHLGIISSKHMVVMNKDTDLKSNEPLSVEKRVEMFFIPGNVASQTDQNDENGFRNSCKRVNHCLDSFTCTLQDVTEHIYNLRELEDREGTSYHDKFLARNYPTPERE